MSATRLRLKPAASVPGRGKERYRRVTARGLAAVTVPRMAVTRMALPNPVPECSNPPAFARPRRQGNNSKIWKLIRPISVRWSLQRKDGETRIKPRKRPPCGLFVNGLVAVTLTSWSVTSGNLRAIHTSALALLSRLLLSHCICLPAFTVLLQ